MVLRAVSFRCAARLDKQSHLPLAGGNKVCSCTVDRSHQPLHVGTCRTPSSDRTTSPTAHTTPKPQDLPRKICEWPAPLPVLSFSRSSTAPESPWVACTLPERAFVRGLYSTRRLTAESQVVASSVLRSPLPPRSPFLAQDDSRGCRRAHHQARPQGSDALPDRCYPPRLARHPPSALRHR